MTFKEKRAQIQKQFEESQDWLAKYEWLEEHLNPKRTLPVQGYFFAYTASYRSLGYDQLLETKLQAPAQFLVASALLELVETRLLEGPTPSRSRLPKMSAAEVSQFTVAEDIYAACLSPEDVVYQRRDFTACKRLAGHTIEWGDHVVFSGKRLDNLDGWQAWVSGDHMKNLDGMSVVHVEHLSDV